MPQTATTAWIMLIMLGTLMYYCAIDLENAIDDGSKDDANMSE